MAALGAAADDCGRAAAAGISSRPRRGVDRRRHRRDRLRILRVAALGRQRAAGALPARFIIDTGETGRGGRAEEGSRLRRARARQAGCGRSSRTDRGALEEACGARRRAMGGEEFKRANDELAAGYKDYEKREYVT